MSPMNCTSISCTIESLKYFSTTFIHLVVSVLSIYTIQVRSHNSQCNTIKPIFHLTPPAPKMPNHPRLQTFYRSARSLLRHPLMQQVMAEDQTFTNAVRHFVRRFTDERFGPHGSRWTSCTAWSAARCAWSRPAAAPGRCTSGCASTFAGRSSSCEACSAVGSGPCWRRPSVPSA